MGWREHFDDEDLGWVQGARRGVESSGCPIPLWLPGRLVG